MAKGGQGFGLNIWANTAQLVEGINKANRSIDGFASTVKRTMAAVGIGFAVHQVVAFTKATLATVDALEENAQKAGIAATSLKLYNVMAEMSGASSEKLVTSLGILSKNLVGLAKEGSGAEKALKGMGIDPKSIKSTEDALMKISAGFHKMADGYGKVATARALFGRGGTSLIPFLNEGPKAFEELQKRLESLGFRFDEVAIKQAAKLQDELDLMGWTMKNLGTEIVMGTLPALLQIVKVMGEFQVKGEGLNKIGEGVGKGLKFIAQAGLEVAQAIELASLAFEKMKEAPIKTILGISKVSFKKEFDEINKKYLEMIANLDKPFTFNMPKKKTGEAPDLVDNSKEIEKAANEYKRMADSVNRYIDSIEKMNPLLTDQEKELLGLSQAYKELIEKIDEMSYATNAQKQALKDTIDKTYEMALGYNKLSEEMKKATQESEDEASWMETKIGLEQKWLDFLTREDELRRSITTTIQKQKEAEQVMFGIKNKAQGYTAGYGMDIGEMQKRLSATTNVPSTSEFAIDPDVLMQSRDILNDITSLSAQYFANMASYDTSMSVWTQENEALAAFAESWGITQEELVKGSVNTAATLGEVWGDVSRQIGSAMTSSIVDLIKGTFDAKKAVESLATSILSTLVNALIELAVKQVVLATVGNGIMITQAAATTAAMTSIAASAGTAAAMMSMATYGTSASVGAGVYAASLASSMALNEAAITASMGSTGMAQGGVINEHIVGRGLQSGTVYEFGEEGPERVTPMRGRSASNITININGNVLNNHDELARILVPAIRKAEYDGV